MDKDGLYFAKRLHIFVFALAVGYISVTALWVVLVFLFG